MRFEFRVIDGPHLDWRFGVRPNSEYSVGRANESDMSIPDSMMSSSHFKLQTSERLCRISDLNSTNGTFLNDERIQTAELSDGDIIRAGDTKFRFTAVSNVANDVGQHVSPQVTPPSSESPPISDVQIDSRLPAISQCTPRDSAEAPPPNAEQVLEVRHEPQGRSICHYARVEIQHPTGIDTVDLGLGETATFGRTDHADQMVPDSQISALHFSLTHENETVILRDLGSRNGTFVNGVKTATATLSAGQQFKAGSSVFTVSSFDSKKPDATGGLKPSTESFNAASLSTFSFPSNLTWPFEQGLNDEDIHVRVAALLAAVSQRQSWIVEYCRSTVVSTTLDTLHLAAVLVAIAEIDLALLKRLLLTDALGPTRFRLASIVGSPQLIPLLITIMQSSDATTAYYAGEAFSRITGVDIDSEELAKVDDHESEEPLEVYLPDPAIAASEWQDLSQQLGTARRISNGIVTETMECEIASDEIDMESLLLRRIRHVFQGTEQPTAEFLFLCQDYLTHK